MFQKVSSREFYSQFRRLCRDYSKGFPCENLAHCVQQFQAVLSSNSSGIDDLYVMELFQIMLEEFRDECVRRIDELGKYCPRNRDVSGCDSGNR